MTKAPLLWVSVFTAAAWRARWSLGRFQVPGRLYPRAMWGLKFGVLAGVISLHNPYLVVSAWRPHDPEKNVA